MKIQTIAYRNAQSTDKDAILSLLRKFGGDERAFITAEFIVATENDKIVGCIRTVQAETDCKEVASLAINRQYQGLHI